MLPMLWLLVYDRVESSYLQHKSLSVWTRILVQGVQIFLKVVKYKFEKLQKNFLVWYIANLGTSKAAEGNATVLLGKLLLCW